MNRQPNWDELSRTIRDEVERAVNSQDFQNMAQNVRRVVENAADAGGEAIRRAAQTVRQGSQTTQIRVADLYGKTGAKVIGGLAKTVFGGSFTFLCGIGTLGLLFTGGVPAALVCGGLLGLSGWMLSSGVRTMGIVSRFRTYRKMLGKKTQCALEKLARAVGKDIPFVRKDVTKMISEGYFLEGHLDHEQNHLITSDITYREFEQARLRLEQARQQKAAEEANRPDPRVQEVLDKGNAFIARIRKCNDDIPGKSVSAKIDRIEQIVRRIFDRVRTNPEVIPDLKKLMDYYLPMTVKLLTAYADMDAQPVQGENIQNSKREIEGTLDTLSVAFEKILDELFQETALDISSDISVLNAMLAREGLTEDELTKMRNRQNS
ncbi:MAG: 5-bromo-4-chloroindolyl phosphate hydrolysis family protein [Oscillospiraceae bacterium]|nr:5-bromo-4-chloroindolyl phosphate hydrolysis family protein [Oscillospiraceae bacterium]